MAVVRREVTAEELLRIPEDGFRYELIRGELRQMTPAGNVHGRIAMNFGTALNNHVKAHGLGTVYAAETGFRLASDPDTVLAPDVAFVSRGAPDLAVEVISPGDSHVEVEEKVFDWLEAGTRMVLTINPRKRSVTVYRSLADITVLTEKDILDGGEVVPGFRLAVRDVFA
jgi:Uma2 family endonuclease